LAETVWIPTVERPARSTIVADGKANCKHRCVIFRFSHYAIVCFPPSLRLFTFFARERNSSAQKKADFQAKRLAEKIRLVHIPFGLFNPNACY
jgi:hypothetical protein